ncbi:DNA polymerase III subunit delta', partial [Azoarcus sp. TTM-91]|uniref:DNA polymerase III subunit delta' C-terminal domain-containing protein n=1 Tax=Azoarcus sp. TTM-91 TaxID=2691581 RepID=UPI0016AB318D
EVDAAMVAICGGMPLAAERLAAQGGRALLQRFVADVARPQGSDPLKLAGQWEAWLKSKETLAAGFGLPQLVDWMQRWVADIAALRLGGKVRFFPGQAAQLEALAARATVAAVTGCYNELSQIRRVAQHPLNMRLVLEDMLLRYMRATHGARG